MNKLADEIKSIFSAELEKFRSNVLEYIEGAFDLSESEAESSESLPKKRPAKSTTSKLKKNSKIIEAKLEIKKKTEKASESDSDSLGLSSSLSDSENSSPKKSASTLEPEFDPSSLVRTLPSVRLLIEKFKTSPVNKSSIIDALNSMFRENFNSSALEIIKELKLGILLKEFYVNQTDLKLKNQIKMLIAMLKDQMNVFIKANDSKKWEVILKNINEAIYKKIDQEILVNFKRIMEYLQEKVNDKEVPVVQQIIRAVNVLTKDTKNEEVRNKGKVLLEKWQQNSGNPKKFKNNYH